MENKSKKLFYIILTAIMSGLSAVLMLIEFPLLPSSYLKMDFSDIPAIIAGVVGTPILSLFCELIKNLIDLVTKGLGTTLGVGNILNFLVGTAYTLPFCMLYKKYGLKKPKFIITLSVPALSMIVIGFFANLLFTPLYLKYFAGMDSTFTANLALSVTATLFNLIKSAILTVIAVVLVPLVENRLPKSIKLPKK